MRKTSEFKVKINRERVALNNAIASCNHLLADLTAGIAVYSAPVDRAVSSRLMAVKQRLLALPSLLARVLVAKSRPVVAAELRERMEDAIEQLSDLDKDELAEGGELKIETGVEVLDEVTEGMPEEGGDNAGGGDEEND